MIKTKIVETTEKYDENGRLIEKIIREKTSEDDTKYYPSCSPQINTPYQFDPCKITCESNVD